MALDLSLTGSAKQITAGSYDGMRSGGKSPQRRGGTALKRSVSEPKLAKSFFELVDRNKNGAIDKSELRRAQKILINNLSSDADIIPTLDIDHMDTDADGHGQPLAKAERSW